MESTDKIPEPLSATFVGSFAYYTIKDRMPDIITKAIDLTTRSRAELIERFGKEAEADIKRVLENLNALKYELQTDKPYKFLTDESQDANLWNEALKSMHAASSEEESTWFKGSWLFSECYMYRRIREIMLSCTSDMIKYDLYEKCKIDACELGQKNVSSLIRSLCTLEKLEDPELIWKNFHNIVQALLWSNKNDLSLSSGKDVNAKTQNLIEKLESYEENILCNHINDLWNHLKELKNKKSSDDKIRVDIILDNCGIELASDLILVDFLLRYELVDEVRLHAKAFPWFISDVTEFDFPLLLKQLQSENSIHVNNFQTRLTSYCEQNKLIFEYENIFWTLSHSYNQMKATVPEFYSELQKKSSLVILKGDLNYRKLIGDLNWPLNTSLDVAVRGFKPTTLCAVRTLKADLCANIDTNESTNENFRKMREKNPTGKDWMNTGDYGVIQLLKV